MHFFVQMAQQRNAGHQEDIVASTEKDHPKSVDGEGTGSGVRPFLSTRKHVDFTSAQRLSQQAKAARRAKKRGRVRLNL